MDMFQIGASKGKAVGQGLMGFGQAVSGAIEEQRETKKEASERNLTKTLTLLNVYTKIGDNLSPEQRTKLYTGALIPLLAKAGAFPEGADKDTISNFIASLSINDKEAMEGLRQDNDKVIDLIYAGKWKDAEKFLTGMENEYSKYPGAKEFLKQSRELLKDEKKQGRGLSKSDKERLELAHEYRVEEGDIEQNRGLSAGKREAMELGSEIRMKEKRTEQGMGLSAGDKERLELAHTYRVEEINKSNALKKEFETFKKELEGTQKVKISDAQLLNAFEEAEKALTERAIVDPKIKSMSEKERDQWKIDFVRKNIKNISTIKGDKTEKEDPLGIL